MRTIDTSRQPPQRASLQPPRLLTIKLRAAGSSTAHADQTDLSGLLGGGYTREEFAAAFAAFKARQRPFILTYFVAGNITTAGDFIGRDLIRPGVPPASELDVLFAQLRSTVARLAASEQREQALRQVEDLKLEAAHGKQADDGRLARILDGLVGLVPGAVGTVVSTFATPLLSGIAGPVTQFVLGKLQRMTGGSEACCQVRTAGVKSHVEGLSTDRQSGRQRPTAAIAGRKLPR